MLSKFLDWDSAFFEKKIFKIEVDNSSTKDELLKTIDNLSGDIYYIFSDYSNQMVSNLGAQLVDSKIIFSKKVIDFHNIDYSSISTYNNENREDLLQLAFLSGEYSRFKTDTKIAYKFKELYSLWLNRSLDKEIADEVFIYKVADKVKGFVTVKKENANCDIGLIAVATEQQGKNIGKKLIAKTEEWCKENNIKTLKVATQKMNKGACLFYKKCGFSVDSENSIYHYYNQILIK